jgi:hypothetical protein
VSDVSGTCPEITFKVERRTIQATSQTSISGGNCRDIKDKVKVEVRGVETSRDAVTASSITIVDKGDDDKGGKSGIP